MIEHPPRDRLALWLRFVYKYQTLGSLAVHDDDMIKYLGTLVLRVGGGSAPTSVSRCEKGSDRCG